MDKKYAISEAHDIFACCHFSKICLFYLYFIDFIDSHEESFYLIFQDILLFL